MIIADIIVTHFNHNTETKVWIWGAHLTHQVIATCATVARVTAKVNAGSGWQKGGPTQY